MRTAISSRRRIKRRCQLGLAVALAIFLVCGQASARCNRSNLENLQQRYETVTTIYEANWSDYIKWMACAAIALGGGGPAVLTACSSEIFNAITSHLAGSVDRATIIDKIANGLEFVDDVKVCRVKFLTYQCETCDCRFCFPHGFNCDKCGEWCRPEPNRHALVLACRRKEEPPRPPPPPVATWIGIGRSDGSNAIFAMDGSPSSRPEVAPWKWCPAGRVLVGANLFSSMESFWVCTTPALEHHPFYVARFVNAAAFVYRVQAGFPVERMGGIEYENCPKLSWSLGRALAPGGSWGGFWACSGSGISPPPVELASRVSVVMYRDTPTSTAQHWYFDPIGASRSRAPEDLSASGAGLMIVNRRTGMALDHSGSVRIGPWWIAILERYVWGAKGQLWRLEKHPTLDRYVIRWPPTGQVLDHVPGEADRRHAVLHDEVRGAPAQLWEIRRVEGDYYSIINHHSRQALDY
ncbi:RICIN domain-containing protein [Sorangium sp. So ce367]|uniref:RICIN domain-containing protein n=1 Tax=Sorangium sp. So ce367 TaxID=3133305 RepID=UPI003F618753